MRSLTPIYALWYEFVNRSYTDYYRFGTYLERKVIIMPRKGYTTIALPNILIDQIEEIIANKKYGYVSKPEFIKEAVREKIRIIKK